MITQILVAQVLTSVIVTVYFRYTTYGWRHLIEVDTIALILMTVTVWILVPESPKFLFDRDMFIELDQTLKQIGRTNGKYTEQNDD